MDRRFKLAGIGELLWDLLPGGRQLGGAPANFAYHARALGADARVISRVGADDLGRELIQRLNGLGVPADCVEIDSDAPTGTVSVELAADGQPRYIIHEHVAWDRIHGDSAARAAAGEADAVCFGTLAQRAEESRQAIHELLALAPANALRIFDVNLRQAFYSPEIILRSLESANVLKVNDAELPILGRMLGLAGDASRQVEALAERYELRTVACTRGALGSWLYAAGSWSRLAATPVRVVDSVGAGDSFTAALALGVLAGWSLEETHRQASALAAYVCSQPGATPLLPESLRAEFESGHSSPL